MADILSAEDNAKIEGYKRAYETAKAAGDTKGMADAHAGAEGIRAGYGYSGGAGGDEYIPLSKAASSGSSGSSGGSGNTNQAAYREYSNSASGGGTSAAGAGSVGAPGTWSPQTGYVALGDWEDRELTGDDRRMVDYYKQVWASTEDPSVKAWAHAQAEAVRNRNGYGGGRDGSQYLPMTGDVTAARLASSYGMTPLPTAPQNSYGDIDQANMDARDYAMVQELKARWNALTAAGDTEGAKAVHDQVEALRAKWGYTGGADGGRFSRLALAEDIIPYTALPVYTPQTEAVQALYDRAREAALAQLATGYNQSRLEAERELAKLPALYQAQRNQVGAESEKQRAAFHEQAAQSGLNAGNGSQADLAFSNQLQGDLGRLNTAQAEAEAEVQHNLTLLYQKYQDQIYEAVTKNDYERAAALMDEYKTYAQSMVETAKAQAGLNLQVDDFNRATRQYQQEQKLRQEQIQRELEQQAWQRQLDTAALLAQNGIYSGLGQFGATATDIANAYTRNAADMGDKAYYILHSRGLA